MCLVCRVRCDKGVTQPGRVRLVIDLSAFDCLERRSHDVPDVRLTSSPRHLHLSGVITHHLITASDMNSFPNGTNDFRVGPLVDAGWIVTLATNRQTIAKTTGARFV
jgi:hypothetical protein